MCEACDGWETAGAAGWDSVDGGMLYEAAGAGKLLGGAEDGVAFWRAIFARASRIDEPLGAAAGGAEPGLPCKAARALGGGLPGGVVDTSIITVSY